MTYIGCENCEKNRFVFFEVKYGFGCGYELRTKKMKVILCRLCYCSSGTEYMRTMLKLDSIVFATCSANFLCMC